MRWIGNGISMLILPPGRSGRMGAMAPQTRKLGTWPESARPRSRISATGSDQRRATCPLRRYGTIPAALRDQRPADRPLLPGRFLGRYCAGAESGSGAGEEEMVVLERRAQGASQASAVSISAPPAERRRATGCAARSGRLPEAAAVVVHAQRVGSHHQPEENRQDQRERRRGIAQPRAGDQQQSQQQFHRGQRPRHQDHRPVRQQFVSVDRHGEQVPVFPQLQPGCIRKHRSQRDSKKQTEIPGHGHFASMWSRKPRNSS